MLCMHAMLSHVTRIWRAPNSRLARQVFGWRAPSPVLARQVASWRAPSAVLAPEFIINTYNYNWFGLIGNVVVRLVFVLSWLSHWCRCVHCSMLVQCVLAYLQVPSTTPIFNWKWTRVQCPCRPGRRRWRGSRRSSRRSSGRSSRRGWRWMWTWWWIGKFRRSRNWQTSGTPCTAPTSF